MDNNVNEFVLANIPSAKPFYVNQLGEIKGIYGKILSNTSKNLKKSIIYRDNNGKQRRIGNIKLIWISFNPNEKVLPNDIFSIIDPNAKIILHPSNIKKTSKAELAKKMTADRRLTLEREKIVDFIKSEGKMSKEKMFEILQLKDRVNGIKILNNLIMKMLKEKLIERESLAVYKLPSNIQKK